MILQFVSKLRLNEINLNKKCLFLCKPSTLYIDINNIIETTQQ